MKRCTFGFDCSAMFLAPGLIADNCPNKETCKTLPNLPANTQIWFNRATETDGDRTIQRIALCSREAATLMLLMRGDCQSPRSLGVISAIDQLQAVLTTARHQLAYGGITTYIAPRNVEAHAYSVKRPRGTYQYNKLASSDAIFEPSERTEKVKVIHLSHDEDPRNQEAKAGIDRRNKLLQLTAKLAAFQQTIVEVLASLDIAES